MTARRPLVLNVNDHVANLYMVSKMLRNSGYDVIEAKSGKEALAAAATERALALVVLDVRLPDMTGFEVCRRIKTSPELRHIKVLHTSATYITTDNKIEGLDAGADGYLTQPFEPQDLVATVRSLIRLHETEADLQTRNEELLVADRRKDEFLAMLAHELRNPLASIKLGLDVLERHPPRDALEERTRGTMQRQTGLLIQLVDDLLDVARVTQGRIELQRTTIDLTALVTAVCEGMRERRFAKREQHLVVHVPAYSVMVEGDGGRLEQVLTNLLDNACKYSDPNTEVCVELEHVGARAVLHVRDHGIGIDPSMLGSVFELFTQVTTSLARSNGGLGIGLTLVKNLVEMHGGTIRAASDGLGKGSDFIVELAATTTAQEVVPAAPEPVARAGAFTVLVVDDNEDGREMLKCLCELHGHTVVEAADGLEAVERAVEAVPDLAIVDIGLPGIDGYEVARRVRAQLNDRAPRLVALSGYGSQEHRAQAFAAGFDEHIAKPIGAEQLERLLSLRASRGSD